MCSPQIADRFYLLFSLFHSPQVSDFPESGKFRGHPRGEAKAMVVYVHSCWARGDFRFGRGRTHEDEVLDVLAQIVSDLHLPLDETLARVKGEHHRHVLANDGDGIRFLVQREPGLHAQEMLKRQRCLGLAVLVTVLGVSVQLQMEAIWKDREKGTGGEALEGRSQN